MADQLAVIGVDLDGVVHDFAESIHSYLIQEEHPGVPKYFDGLEVEYDFFTEWGITHAEYDQIHEQAIVQRFAYNGPILDEAKTHLERLYAEGHTIHIITSRPRSAFTATVKWLVKHDLPFDYLTFSEDKTCVKTDVFIEDNVSNYLSLEKAGCSPFLVDRGWNRKAPGVFRRVKDIGEFADLVIGRTAKEISQSRWLDKFEMIAENVWY